MLVFHLKANKKAGNIIPGLKNEEEEQKRKFLFA